MSEHDIHPQAPSPARSTGTGIKLAIFAFVISWNEVFAATVLTVRHRTLTAYLLTVLSESPLHVQFAGGFILIVPSVLFIFLVRRHLFSLWGISGR